MLGTSCSPSVAGPRGHDTSEQERASRRSGAGQRGPASDAVGGFAGAKPPEFLFRCFALLGTSCSPSVAGPRGHDTSEQERASRRSGAGQRGPVSDAVGGFAGAKPPEFLFRCFALLGTSCSPSVAGPRGHDTSEPERASRRSGAGQRGPASDAVGGFAGAKPPEFLFRCSALLGTSCSPSVAGPRGHDTSEQERASRRSGAGQGGPASDAIGGFAGAKPPEFLFRCFALLGTSCSPSVAGPRGPETSEQERASRRSGAGQGGPASDAVGGFAGAKPPEFLFRCFALLGTRPSSAGRAGRCPVPSYPPRRSAAYYQRRQGAASSKGV